MQTPSAPTGQTDGELSLVAVLRPDVQPNPYALYDQLRACAPVYWDQAPGSPGWWLVTSYREALTALRDPHLSSRRFPDLERVPRMMRPIATVFSQFMLYSDPPQHTRLRTLVSQAFTPHMVESWRPRIHELVDGFLDAVLDAGHMDVIADLAAPLPVTVIADMLGVPAADYVLFKKWSADLAVAFGNGRLSAAEARAAAGAIEAVKDYFRPLLAARRQAPRSDLLQALLAVDDHADALSDEDILANCLLLLVAGHETTTHFIANGVLALIQHPDQLQLLRDNPALMASACEEVLRYDPPIQVVQRQATTDLELGGVPIRAGQQALLVLAAANRDPAQFAQPERLDVIRQPNRHLSFAHGIHYCLGSALARLEGEIAIGTFIRRSGNPQLATSALDWQRNLSVRALTALPVTFTPASPSSQ